jgi:membrane-associated protease RseP (regulator of RpoE activity)|tara:strand:+ start:4280 stop:5221 length:942 start_codon:yes stop_codon:yes gene_type:complete
MKLQFASLLCMLTLQHCVSYEPLVLAPAITLSPEQEPLSSNDDNDHRVDFGFEVGVNESDSLFNIEALPGVRVRTIEPSGPANSAGLKVGDIILSIDESITDHPDTVTALQQNQTDDLNFELKVRRGTVVFQAGMLARALSPSIAPLELYRADPIATRAGYQTELVQIVGRQDLVAAKIVEFFPKSPLPDAGLVKGDIVIALNDVELNSAQDLINRLIQDNELGSTVELTVFSAGGIRVVTVPLWNPGRRISKLSFGPLLNYETGFNPETTKFTLLNLWLFSLYSFNQVEEEKSHSILGLINYSSDLGELNEE